MIINWLFFFTKYIYVPTNANSFVYTYLLGMMTLRGAPQLPAPTILIAANLKSYEAIGFKFSTMYGEFTVHDRFKAKFQSKLSFSLY